VTDSENRDSDADLPTPGDSPLPLAGESVTFTGTLASMTHRQGLQLVERHGGRPMGHVSGQTTILVVGEEGWPLEPDGNPSVKLTLAKELQEQGKPLRILAESDWLNFLGLQEHLDRMNREYTPAMLSQMLDVPVGMIRRWHRVGLITPIRQVYRLPYFDYRQVSSIRKLMELLDSGVPLHRLQQSVERLAEFGGEEFSLDQLQLLAEDRTLLYRDDKSWIDSITGQRLLDFDPPETESISDDFEVVSGRVQDHWTPDEWFAEGCRLSESGEIHEAVEALRMALIDAPHRAEWHFVLAELLYRAGNLPGAVERYHVAVSLDHEYIEAWVQLGCTLQQQGEIRAAEDALKIAIDLHPDYPDALFHMAELLHQAGRTREALPLWQRFLELDQRGPWSETARMRLTEASS